PAVLPALLKFVRPSRLEPLVDIPFTPSPLLVFSHASHGDVEPHAITASIIARAGALASSPIDPAVSATATTATRNCICLAISVALLREYYLAGVPRACAMADSEKISI